MKRLLALIITVCMLASVTLTVSAEDTSGVIKSYPTDGDFLAAATTTFSDTGKASLKFVGDNTSYAYTITTEGITLSDGKNVINQITVEDAYKKGIKIIPNNTYTMSLQSFHGSLECYVDETLVMKHKTKPLLQGMVSAEDLNIKSFEVKAPKVVNNYTITDSQGNEIKSLNVPVGSVPDYIGLALNLTYINGDTKTVQLDSTKYTPVDCLAVGTKSAIFEYENQTYILELNVIHRKNITEKLNKDIEALDIANLSIESKSSVYALSDTYDDLSNIEKNDITAENKIKLDTALEKIEFLLYPYLENSEIVFKDTFDNNDAADKYESHVSVTGDRRSGYWYSQNGKLYQYSPYDEYRSGSFAARTLLKDKNFEISSVSADVQVIDPNVFLGIDACFADGEYFEFYITDKTNVGGGNRIQLFKNGNMIASTVETDSAKWFKPGVWYNLRLTLDDGMVRCYVDDELKLETTNIDANTPGDVLKTTGTVGLRNTEGWGIFDNLTVRGKELPYVTDITPVPELTPGSYADNFNDETADTSPSHWIENNKEDKWMVSADGENKFYSLKGNKTTYSQTWLHVFEQDVDYSAKIRATKLGTLPQMGLYTRVNADDSYIKGGYDFTLKKWFINVRLGIDFDEIITYADTESDVNLNEWYDVQLKAIDKDITLFVNGREVIKTDAGKKVMPGRVGFFAERCNMDADGINLQLLSGQGRVEDGVLEYTPTDTKGTHLGMTVLPDGRYWFFSEGYHNISEDKGQTIKYVENFTDARPTTMVQLPDGSFLHVKNCIDAYRSFDCITWEKVGELPLDKNAKYAQPGDRINMIKLDNGVYRVFHTVGKQSSVGDKKVISETYYSDDLGYTWTQSKNSPMEFTNLDYFCETQIIKLKDGPLIQYCSYNDGGCMRYTLSEDNGETWSGEYALPQIPCALGSFSVKEDPYEEGTFYMSTIYMAPYSLGNGRPRHRISLLRSYDGLNWEYLADIDRWGDISDGGRAEIMQNVNMRISFSEEYVFPLFTRSEQYRNDSSGHNIQLQRIYRFEKSKLKAYDEWPKEYYIDPKAITNITANPTKTKYAVGEEIAGDDAEVKVSCYDGTTETKTLSEVVVTSPDMSTPGRKKVTVDYKLFRDVYEIQVGEDGDWSNPFTDVKNDDWFEKGVGYAYTNGLTSGASETEFSPDENLTRGMLVTLLWRAENKPGVIKDPGFTDLEEGAYYADAVKWAAQHGIVNGTSSTTFEPNENITREQIAAIMLRYAKYKGSGPVGAWAIRLDYSDLAEVSEYAGEAVMYCTMKGLMKGKENNRFAPADNATRAEAVTILQRYFEK